MVEHASWADAARPGRRIGHAIEAHERIGSTNDRARDLLSEPGGEGIAVVAEEQLAGRGRRGRTWSSPPGRNLTVSIGMHPRLAAADAWQLGMAVALAARSACRTVAPVDLKWPNDLVAADGRKLGGLLVETAIHGDAVADAVAGIGLNVNWSTDEMPVELRATATSLAELAGRPVDRVALLGGLLAALAAELERVEAGRSPLDEYRDACRTIGAEVEVSTGGSTIAGRAVDLDAAGGLVLLTPVGTVVVSSGDVTRVRPVVSA